MFIFALLGCQFFAGEFTDDNFGGDAPRAHFDNIWWAMVTVFQVLTGENWNEVIFNAMHVQPVLGFLYMIALTLALDNTPQLLQLPAKAEFLPRLEGEEATWLLRAIRYYAEHHGVQMPF